MSEETFIALGALNVQIPEHLNNFVDESTKIFDKSHNGEHARNVTINAYRIAKSLNQELDTEMLIYGAMLHDVRDHKYPESITEEELDKFMVTNLGADRAKRLKRIINNVSFSKEDKGKRETLDEPDATILTIISDADRLEAIGKVGIERCVEFTTARGGNVPNDVIKHYFEKLSRLLPENFIKTPYARWLAKPLHDEMVALTNHTINWLF